MLKGYVHPDFGRVADVLTRQIPRNRPGGAALTVYHKGQCVVDIWGGTRNRDGDPWQADTLALSFSTTKGVASTLLHVLVDEGLLHYDDPVSQYWPEFGQRSKQTITVRQLLCHEAGLYHIRDMVDDAEQILDWHYMTGALERAKPIHAPGLTNGYHAFTFGWLVGELIQRVTGKSFAQVLQEKLADPLQLDGLYVGLPNEQMDRRSELVNVISAQQRRFQPERIVHSSLMKTITKGLRLASINLESTMAAMVPKGAFLLDFNHPDFVGACIPAANGMFTSRSLAKLYAMLANGGEIDGVRILSRDTVNTIMQVQNRTMGHVIPVAMHWRLGYHRIVAFGNATPHSFGHFGFGGSGAWADPTRNLSAALTLNNGVGTPFGDTRFVHLTTTIVSCAERRYTLPDAEDVRGIGAFFPRPKPVGYPLRLMTGVLPRRNKPNLNAI